MSHRFIFLVICLLLSACAKKEEAGFAPAAEASAGASEDSRVSTAAPRLLAYEHFFSLDVAPAKVPTVHDSVIAACREAVADDCVLLSSSLHSNSPNISAELQLRAKPDGIRRIMKSLASTGTVLNQRVSADDLAAPLADTARRLKMLQDYRSQLEKLRQQASGDIESLIKVSRELTDVQSQIEALSGDQAQMLRRVHTELLTIMISSKEEHAFWRPVANAFAYFLSAFAQGVSSVILAIAYVSPWLITLFGAWLGFRRLRIWWQQRKN